MLINKSAILCSLLSLSLLVNNPARATGMIMIDPGLVPMVPHIAVPVSEIGSHRMGHNQY